MTAKSDLVLYDRHGQLAALVIIKNKRGTTRDWATQFRRNILASEALPPVPFLLIVTPDRLYLWRGAGNEPVLVPPTYEGDPSPMIEPYFRRSRVDPGQVSSLVFEFIVDAWLSDLIRGDRAGGWLEHSGLLSCIHGGRIDHQAAA